MLSYADFFADFGLAQGLMDVFFELLFPVENEEEF